MTKEIMSYFLSRAELKTRDNEWISTYSFYMHSRRNWIVYQKGTFMLPMVKINCSDNNFKKIPPRYTIQYPQPQCMSGRYIADTC